MTTRRSTAGVAATHPSSGARSLRRQILTSGQELYFFSAERSHTRIHPRRPRARPRPPRAPKLDGRQGVHERHQSRADAADNAYQGTPTIPKPFAINMIPQNDEIKGNTFFDWRVGTEYDLAKDSMIYGTVTTGDKAGGFNDTIRDAMGVPTNPPQYTSESVISFEIGSRQHDRE
jgi:hypothetical protein